MYKIMIADDEGIVLQSLKMIIQKHFGSLCMIETAKTGRSAIELAESFRPDITLMDIQMPGINGIDAIEEIQKFSSSTYFIIITAFDKFDYAKKAIDLGVVEFLSKPFSAQSITSVLDKTIKMVDEDRHNREIHLKNKEKLETVIPIIESGMIYTILFQEDYSERIEHLKELLEIKENYGFMMVIEFGDEIKDANMTNPIGAAVKVQRNYQAFSEIVKGFFRCHVGAVMANKVVVFVPCDKPEIEYNERIKIIDTTRDMGTKLRNQMDIEVRVGIGALQSIDQLHQSYNEAVKAMRMTQGMVSHIKDIMPKSLTKQSGLEELEKQFLMQLKQKNAPAFLAKANALYEEIEALFSEDETIFRMKLLEYLIIVKREVKDFVSNSEKTDNREIYGIVKYSGEELKIAFIDYMTWLYECKEEGKEEVYSDLIMEAKTFIDEYYSKDISLDMISRKVNISPYYFSKIFKEETGENFIDYMTAIRIEKAKAALQDKNRSIKEVCLQVGYKDPNYFSRLFKKQVGVTPTEYREGV